MREQSTRGSQQAAKSRRVARLPEALPGRCLLYVAHHEQAQTHATADRR